MPRRTRLCCLAAALALAVVPAARGQAFLELTEAPRPGFPATWAVTELTAHADVRDQSADVRLSQTFKNVGSQPLEARLVFPLPPAAAVRELTLLVDGKELVGTLQKAGEARATYEAIVRRNRDPALLEYAGRGLYRTSVFPIPAGAVRTVQLRYTQLLDTREGLIDLTIPVGSASSSPKPIGKVEVSANIKTARPLKTVYSPSHELELDRPDDKSATAKVELEQVSGRRDVRILFGAADGLVGLNLLAHRDPDDDDREGNVGDGFFLLLAAPDVPRPRRAARPPHAGGGDRHLRLHAGREVRAGHRRGPLRGRPAAAGGHLQRGSPTAAPSRRFRTSCKPATTPAATPPTLSYRVCGPAAAPTSTPPSPPPWAPCPSAATGPPTCCSSPTANPPSGVTDEQQIARNVAEANGGEDAAKARIFTFGVGNGVNARLLDRLSDGGRGVSTYVAPSEDVEASVSGLYAQIAAPVLTDLALDFAFEGTESRARLNRVLPADLPDLFRRAAAERRRPLRAARRRRRNRRT